MVAHTLASKEKRREALTGAGTEGFLASLRTCEAAAGAELVTDFSAQLQLGHRED